MESIAAERLRAVITKCFPAGARIAQLPDQDEFVLHIAWEIEGQPATIIELTIAQEAIEKYSSASEAARRVADVRLTGAIHQKLLLLGPNQKGLEGAIVSWLMGDLT